MRKQFFLDLIARLKNIKNDDDYYNPSDAIKHFDLWNNNTEYLQQSQVFAFPAVFIEFLPIVWHNIGKKTQQADLDFRLHILTESLALSADNSQFQSQALAHLDLIDRIHYCLAQWEGTEYTALISRIQSLTDNNHNSILHNIEVFRTRIEDTFGSFTASHFFNPTLKTSGKLTYKL